MFTKLGFDLETLFGPLVKTEGLAFMYEEGENPSIVQVFRSMWTDMGDYLSRQYAGTDSTISRVTRDGKEGFIGKIDQCLFGSAWRKRTRLAYGHIHSDDLNKRSTIFV